MSIAVAFVPPRSKKVLYAGENPSSDEKRWSAYNSWSEFMRLWTSGARTAVLRTLFVSLLAASASSATPALADALKIGGTGGGLATMQLLVQEFKKSRASVAPEVLPSLGSSGGIKAVLAGAIDVAVSSRALKADERSKGAAEYEYGRTPFVFTTSPSTKASGLTIGQLADIYSGKTTTWPDGRHIRLVLRPVGDSDTDLVKGISPEVARALAAAEKRPGMTFALTDQESAESTEKIPGALGTSTLAQILTEKRALKVLRFNGVEPSVETIRTGRYPYYKRMFIVIGPKASATAREFVAYAQSAAGRGLLTRLGYWVAEPKSGL